MAAPDPQLRAGWVDATLAGELPGLELWSARVEAGPRSSPPGLRLRLSELAGRIGGGHALHMRQDPVPWAYRVLWRKVGLDPDVDRPPAERVVVERLRAGGLPSVNTVADSITIATLETGVPVLAFDAEQVGTEIGLRTTGGGEWLGEGEHPLSDGVIVVADEHRPLATFMGEQPRSVTPGKRTLATLLVSVQAPGVPLISVEEALWMVADGMLTGD